MKGEGMIGCSKEEGGRLVKHYYHGEAIERGRKGIGAFYWPEHT